MSEKNSSANLSTQKTLTEFTVCMAWKHLGIVDDPAGALRDFLTESAPATVAKALHALCAWSPYAPSPSSIESFLNEMSLTLPPHAPHAAAAQSHAMNPAPLEKLETSLGLLIVFAQQTPVGFLQARVAFDVAEVDFVSIAQPAQRRGLARVLMCAFEKFARTRTSAERLLLEVGAENTAAQALYGALGFGKVSTRKRYYGGLEDAWVMEKNL